MSPLTLLWIALLQLHAPAGASRPAPPQGGATQSGATQESASPQSVSPQGASSAPLARPRAAMERRYRYTMPADYRLQGPLTLPKARRGSGLRTGPLAKSARAVPTRAISSAVTWDIQVAIAGMEATTADRTTRAVAARGSLLAHHSIPPPLV